ncbi:hypothetical protein A244_07588 [Pseudomonas syringae pv. actinidiae ICMP 18807]|uniref:Uncharacterized protein n=1 Tax=Pseudomonas syringae pv. actinidiae ICMP 18807 TaxID=1194404 RepID=S6UWP1_PSESF|nr:hypothetical protein A244_07588 [Pseudomonas syringae pv. actinidiae ICMP 18807]
MPQILKTQIDQEVFLRCYLRYFAISQIVQPRTLQTSDKGFLERISHGGEHSPTQRTRQILEQLNSLRLERDGSGQPFLVGGGCAVLRSRFTCFQRSSKISPRRMAVSIANCMMGRIQGLCDASA